MKTYSYNDKVIYFTNKAKDSKSSKQAWYFYGKVKNLVRWYELTEEEMAGHQSYLPKLAKAIEKKFGSTKVESTKVVATTTAKVVESSFTAPAVVQPEVSKNGRTNNALRVKALIANIEAALEIAKEIK
jgi:hypothetical protein